MWNLPGQALFLRLGAKLLRAQLAHPKLGVEGDARTNHKDNRAVTKIAYDTLIRVKTFIFHKMYTRQLICIIYALCHYAMFQSCPPFPEVFGPTLGHHIPVVIPGSLWLVPLSPT
jgi:hypothetical protein